MYQIFVSSTFRDLHPEREAVSWAILKTRNTPAGMEAFPATDDRGWKTIQRTIDDSDYYVLLLAHRYGTIDPTTDMSWTEKEYRYARSKGIPVLAFLRELAETPGNQVETDPDLRRRIEAFRASVGDAHQVKWWKRSDDLVTLVSQAIPGAIQDSIDEEAPRPGWIRGSVGGMKIAAEIAALSDENRRLREEVAALRDERSSSRVEQRPAMLLQTGTTNKGPTRLTYSFAVQNVGSCGFAVQAVRWLWQAAGGPVNVVESSLDPARPQFLAPNTQSMNFTLELTKERLMAGVGAGAGAVREIDASLRLTAILTAVSKPYDIEATETFAVKGELLAAPAGRSDVLAVRS